MNGKRFKDASVRSNLTDEQDKTDEAILQQYKGQENETYDQIVVTIFYIHGANWSDLKCRSKAGSAHTKHVNLTVYSDKGESVSIRVKIANHGLSTPNTSKLPGFPVRTTICTIMYSKWPN